AEIAVLDPGEGQRHRQDGGDPADDQDRLVEGPEAVSLLLGAGGWRQRRQPKALAMSETAGPSRTMKIAGKMNATSGNRIFTGSLAAASRAHCWRRVRTSSAAVFRTRPTGIPSASACVSVSTKFDSSGTSVRFLRLWSASRRGRPSSIS